MLRVLWEAETPLNLSTSPIIQWSAALPTPGTGFERVVVSAGESFETKRTGLTSSPPDSSETMSPPVGSLPALAAHVLVIV